MGKRQKQSVGSKKLPLWESAAHTLVWRGQAWKHFQHEALKQEAILEAFEKAGWPDFLEAAAVGISKRATIKNLNQSLKGLLHFRREGNGSRICWEPVKRR